MDRLDLRLVEYFVAVAEELHFGRAAARLHIAQPSLSHQIRRMEEQLGVTLFQRTSRRVELTPAGEVLLRDGRRLLAQAQRAINAARAAGREQLTVGFGGSAASGLLPAVLRVFSERCPSVEVMLRELRLDGAEDILDGRVDIAFTRLEPGEVEAEVEVLSREPRVVALPVGHPLAGCDSLAFEDLRDESFITNPVLQRAGPPVTWLAEQQRHGLPGRVAAEAASLPETLALVATGRGVCLLPGSVARIHPRPDICYVEVPDATPAVVSLAWNRHGGRPVVDAFIRIVRQVAAQHPGAC
jgi:DNA-binding transcriptional LysR family regulator